MNVIARKFSYTFLNKRLLEFERLLRRTLAKFAQFNELGGLNMRVISRYPHKL